MNIYRTDIRMHPAHKNGKLAYETTMGGPGRCPYCGHLQHRHQAGIRGREIEVHCDDCDLISPRICIIVPPPEKHFRQNSSTPRRSRTDQERKNWSRHTS